MELILDTCAILSLVGLVERRLSDDTLDRIRRSTVVGVSACSGFEIAIKNKKGNLPVNPFKSPQALWSFCLRHYDLTEVEVNARCFFDSVQLPDLHADPFDRLILATAIKFESTVVSYDGLFSRYGVEVIC